MTLSPQLKNEFTKDVILVTIISIAVGLIGFLILFFLLPGKYFKSYPLIHLFFYGYALISGYKVKRAESDLKKTKTIKVFFINRSIKIVLAILIMFAYILTYKETAKTFSIVFVSFYFLFLIYDTWFFSKLPKKKLK